MYQRGRRLSSVAGAIALQRELDVLGFGITLPQGASQSTAEYWRAQRAADGYVRHWLQSAAANTNAGPNPLRSASRVQSWRLDLGAATENSEAWVAGQRASLEWAAEYDLWRQWDATLDRRTCPVCVNAHGTVVRANEAFPAGEPGAVHPRCRCDFVVLPRDAVDLQWYAYAA